MTASAQPFSDGTAAPDLAQVEVIAPNFKKRLSGVTSTIVQLVPLQEKTIGIATLGPGLPDFLPKLRWWQVFGLWRRPASGRKRIWHARRNVEMIGGIFYFNYPGASGLTSGAVFGRRSGSRAASHAIERRELQHAPPR